MDSVTTGNRAVGGSDAQYLASDYFYLFTGRQTRYEGWFINGPTKDIPFVKIIERIVPLETLSIPMECIGITHTPERCYWELVNGATMSWRLTEGGLQVAASQLVDLSLVLDIRGIYSTPTDGRRYAIVQQTPSTLTLKYTDPLLPETIYLHIRWAGGKPLSLQGEWKSVAYPRDAARHSPPDNLYVYTLGTLSSTQVALGAGFSEEVAIEHCQEAWEQELLFPNRGLDHTEQGLKELVTAAKESTQQSLNWLRSDDGYWAGLPWFHQVWSRDELITALGLPPATQLALIDKYLSLAPVQGELPTFFGSGTTCADGVTWLCLLMKEYGLDNLLKSINREKLVRALKTIHHQIKEKRMAHHGLVWSGHNATWMDTIGRQGFRLEVQTGYSLLLELLFELTGHERYHRERLLMLGRIRQHFWHRDYLWDGLDDSSKRPNVFLAYLLQPDLLKANQWQSCFDVILKGTLLDWGGLSSIDTLHPAYHAYSTGQDNQSYHNGDSWFFVNNMAGIALHRFNQRHFAKVITGLLESSTNETLFCHMIGAPGEISSAAELDSWGCGIQGFSGGTYLAFLKELGL